VQLKDAQTVLSKIEERYENTCSLCEYSEFGMNIVCVEVNGITQSRLLFGEICLLIREDLYGKFPFSTGVDNVWLSNFYGADDDCRSDKESFNRELRVIKIWNMPSPYSLPVIGQDRCMQASSIKDSNVSGTFMRLARSIDSSSYLSIRNLKDGKVMYFVHGISHGKLDSTLCSIFESVDDIMTCSIVSLKNAKGAWIGDSAILLSENTLSPAECMQ